MSDRRTVLIVDDEPLKVLTLEENLEQSGFRVLTAVNGEEALRLLQTKTIDALVTDVRMPGMDGLALLEASAKLDARRPVLVMTGYEEVQDAVRAMKAGAINYVTKPVSGEEIALRLDRALSDSQLAGENLRLRYEVERLKGQSEPVIVGAGMAPVEQALEKAAATDATVLIVGETGTGKEVCARYLHHHSNRSSGPFVVVPCAALPPTLIESELFGHEKGAFTGATGRRAGYFSSAAAGTIFLDDVDDLPLDAQGRLLHVLQSRSFQRVGGTKIEQANVRVVAATKKDLTALVKERLFRDDLMYRLSVVTLQIPPLRARREDIPALAEFFLGCALQRLGRKTKAFSPQALKALTEYDWPGNVRELEHLVESTVIMHSGAQIDARDLPLSMNPSAPQTGPLFSLHTDGKEDIPLADAVQQFEGALLQWAYEKAGRNQGSAARLLGIPRSTFQYTWAKLHATNGTSSTITNG